MSILKGRLPLWIHLLHAATLCALPKGMEVISGDVASSQADVHSLTIQAPNRSIIHFESFDIGPQERVHFIQPDQNASVLGRIVGQDPTQILGRLDANGRLFLVNSQGIYFGPNSSVNVHALIASTLDIRNEDFLADRYVFQEEGNGSIINDGSIVAETSVGFLSSSIQNRGSILAKTGSVLLASGNKVTLDFSGDGLLQFAVEGDLENALIENQGFIKASRGVVDLSLRSAKRALQAVVNTDGLSVANAMEVVDGTVRLFAKSNIDAACIHIDGDGKTEPVLARIDPLF